MDPDSRFDIFVKTVLIAGLFVSLGAGCARSVVEPKSSALSNVSASSSSALEDASNGVRDWCGSLKQAKEFFSAFDWKIFDIALEQKLGMQWKEPAVCVTRDANYDSYTKDYVRTTGDSSIGYNYIYFTMRYGGDKKLIQEQNPVFVPSSNQVSNQQIALLGFWDPSTSTVMFSRPIAMSWVGEGTWFPRIWLDVTDSSKPVVKGDTFYGIVWETGAKGIGTFSPIDDATRACTTDDLKCN